MTRLAIAVFLAALLLPAAGAEAAAKRCPKAGVVAENRKAVVFVRHDGDDHVLRGCLKRSRERTNLATWFSCGCSTGDEPEPQVWLERRFAAVNPYFCPPDGSPCGGHVRVFDLRSGIRLRDVDTGGAASDVVLARRGAVALIAARGLVTADGSGEALLDPVAQAGSLAYAREARTLYWTSAGLPRSAPFG
jgi:hypothetical protein